MVLFFHHLIFSLFSVILVHEHGNGAALGRFSERIYARLLGRVPFHIEIGAVFLILKWGLSDVTRIEFGRSYTWQENTLLTLLRRKHPILSPLDHITRLPEIPCVFVMVCALLDIRSHLSIVHRPHLVELMCGVPGHEHLFRTLGFFQMHPATNTQPYQVISVLFRQFHR